MRRLDVAKVASAICHAPDTTRELAPSVRLMTDRGGVALRSCSPHDESRNQNDKTTNHETGENLMSKIRAFVVLRSEEHTSELQSHRDLHSFPTRRSSDLAILLAAR